MVGGAPAHIINHLIIISMRDECTGLEELLYGGEVRLKNHCHAIDYTEIAHGVPVTYMRLVVESLKEMNVKILPAAHCNTAAKQRHHTVPNATYRPSHARTLEILPQRENSGVARRCQPH